MKYVFYAGMFKEVGSDVGSTHGHKTKRVADVETLFADLYGTLEKVGWQLLGGSCDLVVYTFSLRCAYSMGPVG